jgi:hypothetical protein
MNSRHLSVGDTQSMTNKNKKQQQLPQIQQQLKQLKEKLNNVQKKKRSNLPMRNKPRINLDAMSRLSPCARKYALACIDPRNPDAQGACVPSWPSRSSWKTCGWVRGTGYIGAGGFGFVAVSPCLANDYRTIYYSDGTYAGTAIGTDTTVAGVNMSLMTNTGQQSSQLVVAGASPNQVAPAIQGRIVAGSLKSEYVGTLSNSGGLLYTSAPADRLNLEGYNTALLGARRDTAIIPVQMGKITETVVCGGFPSEIAYYSLQQGESAAVNNSKYIYPFSNGQLAANLSYGSVIMAHVYIGTPGEPFFYDYYQSHEFTGQGISSRSTVTHSDSSGMQEVNTAVNRLQEEKAAHPNASAKTIFNKVLAQVQDESSPLHRGIQAGLRGAALYREYNRMPTPHPRNPYLTAG